MLIYLHRHKKIHTVSKRKLYIYIYTCICIHIHAYIHSPMCAVTSYSTYALCETVQSAMNAWSMKVGAAMPAGAFAHAPCLHSNVYSYHSVICQEIVWSELNSQFHPVSNAICAGHRGQWGHVQYLLPLLLACFVRCHPAALMCSSICAWHPKSTILKKSHWPHSLKFQQGKLYTPQCRNWFTSSQLYSGIAHTSHSP